MYDVKIHIPQQMELMLLSRKQGKLEMFNDAVTTIKVLSKDNGLIQDLNNFENEYNQKIIEEVKKVDTKRAETPFKGKTYEEMLDYLEEIETPRDKAINDLLLEYMQTIEEYLIKYLSKVDLESDG